MFQSTHIMTDDGGIDIKHHKTIHALTDPVRMIIIHLLCRWNVNKYCCTAIFGNVLYCMIHQLLTHTTSCPIIL